MGLVEQVNSLEQVTDVNNIGLDSHARPIINGSKISPVLQAEPFITHFQLDINDTGIHSISHSSAGELEAIMRMTEKTTLSKETKGDAQLASELAIIRACGRDIMELQGREIDSVTEGETMFGAAFEGCDKVTFNLFLKIDQKKRLVSQEKEAKRKEPGKNTVPKEVRNLVSHMNFKDGKP
ncbi:hypothetical protein HAX54_021411 [Datura stramonium]|uniref:Uncharacterized protein n=1 Tax=Datura stramonium TaxID=4076 RepID=A0ABS8UUS4_DATST|nr:hypothetical protein [Datura stramonium]